MLLGGAEECADGAGAEDAGGLLVLVCSLSHGGGKGWFAAQVVEPGIAGEGLVAEEAVVYGAGEHF